MSVFAKAKEAAAKAPAKAPKGKKRESFNVAGVERLATMKALVKSMEGAIETLENEVKSQAAVKLVEQGRQVRKRPENFDITEGGASAQVQCKKRSSRSVLTESEAAILARAGVSVETNVTQQETFIINSKYAKDGELLEKVGAAIEGIDGVPDDFIQAQNEVSSTVVPDQALDEIFNQDLDAPTQARLVEIVYTIALRTKAEGKTTEDLLKQMTALLKK